MSRARDDVTPTTHFRSIPGPLEHCDPLPLQRLHQRRISRTRSINGRFLLLQRFLVERLLLLIFLRAEPLCMAKWSVLSLLIKYCGHAVQSVNHSRWSDDVIDRRFCSTWIFRQHLFVDVARPFEPLSSPAPRLRHPRHTVHLAPEDGPDQETEGDRRGGLVRSTPRSLAGHFCCTQDLCPPKLGNFTPISGIRILR